MTLRGLGLALNRSWALHVYIYIYIYIYRYMCIYILRMLLQLLPPIILFRYSAGKACGPLPAPSSGRILSVCVCVGRSLLGPPSGVSSFPGDVSTRHVSSSRSCSRSSMFSRSNSNILSSSICATCAILRRLSASVGCTLVWAFQFNLICWRVCVRVCVCVRLCLSAGND